MPEFNADLKLEELDGTDGFRIDGVAAEDGLGFSVSGAGDVNGDGFDDFIIGAPYADPNGSSSGSSYVVFGKADGFAANFDLTSLDGSNGFRLDGVAAADYSAGSVSSAGDVNGDGYGDLIISALGADPNGSASGSSYVVFGKADGFAAVMDLSSLDGNNGFRLNGASELNTSGRSVSSAGDVNGDGYDDILIGADDRANGAGNAYVVFGKAHGFSATMDLGSLDGTDGFRIDGVASGDGTGWSVNSAGDVNGDGFDDIIIGAYAADFNGTRSGSSYVVFGKADGFAATMDLASLDGTSGFRIDGLTDGFSDASGSSVSSAGDVNNDGFDDIIIGAPQTLNGLNPPGMSFVVFGRAPTEAVVRVGSAASQQISGGIGDDTLSGEAGNDRLVGHGGNDILTGGAGADTLDGGAGSDTASYEGSAAGVRVDLLLGTASGGDAAGDTLTGIENLTGSDFNDVLLGDGAGNILTGGAGSDVLWARSGNDTLFGGDGNDLLAGLAGDDLLQGGAGADRLDGGSGVDTASYAGSAAGVRVDLGLGTGLNGDAAVDVLTSIENLTGSDFNDVLLGNGGANILTGGGGNDVLWARAGNDVAFGGDGNDLLAGLAGNDRLNGEGGNDRLDGGTGADILDGGTGDDSLTGGTGADTFVFSDSWGDDTVTDFEDGVDLFDFSGSGLGFADLTISQAGADTLIEDAFGNSITLEGITASDITADDFLF